MLFLVSTVFDYPWGNVSMENRLVICRKSLVINPSKIFYFGVVASWNILGVVISLSTEFL